MTIVFKRLKNIALGVVPGFDNVTRIFEKKSQHPILDANIQLISRLKCTI